jgi:hypothetical protein
MTPCSLQPKPPWRPRASGLGNYLACLWRCANDRAIYEGAITDDQAKEMGDFEQTAYAPHGSIIHWTTQVGIGCVFPPREPTPAEVEEAAEHFVDEAAAVAGSPQTWEDAKDAAAHAFRTGNPKAYAPPAADWAKALGRAGPDVPVNEQGLFKGDEQRQKQAIAAASQMLANRLPRARDGKPWQAEVAVEADWITGHIDLLSHDDVEIGDIKTTAKPPEMGGYLKPGYLVQVIVYGRLKRSRRAFIEYVDSLQGRWSCRVDVDLTVPERQAFGDQLEAFCRFIMSDQLWQVAYPNIGAHCRDTWCPYQKSCAKKLFPAPGIFYDVTKAMRPSGVVAIGGLVR